MELPDKSGGKQEPTKRVTAPVVSGAKKVPRPASKRFMAFLFAESPKSLGHKILESVVIPRVKAGFEEAANSFLAGMLWGDSARPTGVVRGTVARGGINYQGMSSGSSLLQARQATAPAAVSYEDLVLNTQQEAEILLGNLYELMNQYRVVAVGDLNDLIGMTSKISDNGYGWTSLDGARISQDRAGFRLELPRPVLI